MLGEIPRFSFTISLMRCTGISKCSASAFWVSSIGSRNSLSKITPGWVYILSLGIITGTFSYFRCNILNYGKCNRILAGYFPISLLTGASLRLVPRSKKFYWSGLLTCVNFCKQANSNQYREQSSYKQNMTDCPKQELGNETKISFFCTPLTLYLSPSHLLTLTHHLDGFQVLCNVYNN